MGEAIASPEALTADRFPLFSRFPELEESLPRVTFSTGPSPVAHLRELGKRIGRDDIWIKNDGLYGTLYGGNKPRKLEFILADAVAKGAKTVPEGQPRQGPARELEYPNVLVRTSSRLHSSDGQALAIGREPRAFPIPKGFCQRGGVSLAIDPDQLARNFL